MKSPQESFEKQFTVILWSISDVQMAGIGRVRAGVHHNMKVKWTIIHPQKHPENAVTPCKRNNNKIDPKLSTKIAIHNVFKKIK